MALLCVKRRQEWQDRESHKTTGNYEWLRHFLSCSPFVFSFASLYRSSSLMLLTTVKGSWERKRKDMYTHTIWLLSPSCTIHRLPLLMKSYSQWYRVNGDAAELCRRPCDERYKLGIGKFSSNLARKKARKCGIILLLMENRSEDGRYEDSCGIIIIFMQSIKWSSRWKEKIIKYIPYRDEININK